jgi:lipoprotein NlpD
MALVALLLATVLSGCGSTGPAPVYEGYGLAPAGYYRVRRGDTLHKIAGRHKIGYETLARWNNLGPPYRIYAGSLLRVEPPEGKGGAKNQDALRTVTATKKTKRKKQAGAARTASVGTADNASKSSSRGSGRVAQGLHWRWPLEGKVVRRFRSGDRTRRGIRVAGHRGEKVRAAEAGTVVYSGSGLKGYGNLIIVKHNDGYLSAYGFNRRLLVREGTAVKRGQSVAEVGQASDGEYLLHFEIRRNGTAVDPLKYLP